MCPAPAFHDARMMSERYKIREAVSTVTDSEQALYLFTPTRWILMGR
jgi:hypothetical protein